MEYHIWDVVVPVSLTVLLLVLVFTIAVCKYKRCMNIGKDAALRRHRKLWMTCGSLGNDYPSRSTTEQSLYSPTFDSQRPEGSSIDIGIQTSQILFPLDIPTKTSFSTLQSESKPCKNETTKSENETKQTESETTLNENDTAPNKTEMKTENILKPAKSCTMQHESKTKYSENGIIQGNKFQNNVALNCRDILTHCYPKQDSHAHKQCFDQSCQKTGHGPSGELRTKQIFDAVVHSYGSENELSMCDDTSQIENLLCEQSQSFGDLVQRYSEDTMLLPIEQHV